MTKKYLYIRREIWERDPRNATNGKRTLQQMIRLFKWPQMFVLVCIIACGGFMVLSGILWPENFLAICIPLGILLILSYLSQVLREQFFYHLEPRQDELKQVKQDYDTYVKNIHAILEEYGVNTKEDAEKLKNECASTLKEHEQKFSFLNSQVMNALIGVPLGALVASIIYTGNETNPIGILFVVTFGSSIIIVLKVINVIAFYTKGYFKDKYVLDALCELDYSSFDMTDDNNAEATNTALTDR